MRGKRLTAKDNLRNEIPEKMTVEEYREFLKTGKFKSNLPKKKRVTK